MVLVNLKRQFLVNLRSILLVVVVACCLLSEVSGQTRPDLSRIAKREDKIDAWRNYLNELLGYNESGRSDSKLLIKEARYGLKLCLANDFKRHAMFYLFTGCAFEKLRQYDSAAFYLEKSVALAGKSYSPNYEITGLSRLNYVYDYSRNVPMRNATLERIRKIADTSKSLNTRELSVSALGEYYQDIDDYEKAIKYQLESIELYKQLLKTDTLIVSIGNIGRKLCNVAVLYNTLGRNEKAIQYLDEAREYLGDRILREGEESLYTGYIQSYLGMDRIDSAAVYYKLIYQKMAPGDTLHHVLSSANKLFGDYYLEKNEIKKAEHHAQLALKSASKSQEASDLINAKVLFGSVLYRQQKFEKAISFLNPVLKEPFDFDKVTLAGIRATLAKSYAALKEWEKAYFYLDTYSLLKDTLQIAAADKNFNEIEAKYQNTQKIQQLKVKNLQLSDARKQRFWLITGLLLVLVVTCLTFVIYRNKKRTADLLDQKNKELAELNRDLEQANQTKVKLFGIISHDLRSPISRIHQFLKLYQMNPELHDQEQKAVLGMKIQEATASLLDTMEDMLLWSKTQMKHFSVHLQETEILSVVDQCEQLLQLDLDTKKIMLKKQIPNGKQVSTDPYFLQTIVRNLLQNAIKAVPENEVIQINFTDQDGQAVLAIINRGNGFDQHHYEAILEGKDSGNGHSGLGLRLLTELASKLDMKIEFKIDQEQRTVAEIQFPKIGAY